MAKFKIGMARPSEQRMDINASSEKEAMEKVGRMNRDYIVKSAKPVQYTVFYYKKPNRSDRFIEIDAWDEKEALKRFERQYSDYIAVEISKQI